MTAATRQTGDERVTDQVRGTPGLMRRLREHTAAIHAATEALPLMQTVLGPQPSNAGYGHYLLTLHGVYAALEPALYAAVPPPLLTALGIAPKLPALQQDLRALRGSAAAEPPPAEDLRSEIDRRLSAAGTQRTAMALGGLYVLEGATLGGQVIARRLRSHWPAACAARSCGDSTDGGTGNGQHVALSPPAGGPQAAQAAAVPLPTAFLEFRSHRRTGDWRCFGRALETWAVQLPHSVPAVLNGALSTFEVMHAAFARAGANATHGQTRGSPGCPSDVSDLPPTERTST
ncbi:biliverdin-producing heme oxygenase [uncultured Thiohalocapsa sp.]|uniref:biliverdin-producing heme oxygenase n=1 Tax=uncultured Thiohalocapsa sp. TaxID=768990 RepID=UPI0025D5F7B8|nr:biliverdin-producing heme oxygenase [uncultured Thiohalocapsa sp.]